MTLLNLKELFDADMIQNIRTVLPKTSWSKVKFHFVKDRFELELDIANISWIYTVACIKTPHIIKSGAQ